MLRKRVSLGFTLVELLVTIVVLAIIAGLAAPSFTGLIASMQVRSVAQDLANDLSLARSEALKRNAQITVTPSAAGWGGGWQVAVSTSGTVISSRGAAKSTLSVIGTSSGTAINFAGNGRILNSSSSTDYGTNLTWTISAPGYASSARCIIITPTGTARTKMGGC